MRVPLKGINRITKRLADGTVRTYFYAWKGGPALTGAWGSPEFHASYNVAVATKKAGPAGTLQSVLDAYQTMTEFTGLSERTREDYVGIIKKIEIEFGDFPLSALTDRKTRGEFRAIEAGLSMLRTGDLILVQADQVEPSLAFIQQFIAANPGGTCSAAPGGCESTVIDRLAGNGQADGGTQANGQVMPAQTLS